MIGNNATDVKRFGSRECLGDDSVSATTLLLTLNFTFWGSLMIAVLFWVVRDVPVYGLDPFSDPLVAIMLFLPLSILSWCMVRVDERIRRTVRPERQGSWHD